MASPLPHTVIGALTPFWRRVRSGLVTGQLATALVLLVAAATIMRTVADLTAIVISIRLGSCWSASSLRACSASIPMRSSAGAHRHRGASGTWAEIVGVVRDVRMRGPERDVQAAIYLPFAQAAIARTAYGIIQSTAGVDTLVPAVRDAVARIDPDLPLYNIRLFHDIRSSYLADRRLAMQLMSLFGLVALALAVVGVYGAIRYLAQRRTREIGIRMALGASPGQVARRVFADGALPVASGVALGSAAAVALSGVLAATVPGTTPADIRLMIVVAAAVAAVALVAAWLPARSTARVDPVAALRSE